jgi:hypothetical protein
MCKHHRVAPPLAWLQILYMYTPYPSDWRTPTMAWAPGRGETRRRALRREQHQLLRSSGAATCTARDRGTTTTCSCIIDPLDNVPLGAKVWTQAGPVPKAHTLDQMAVKDQRAMQARRFSALPTGSGAQRTTARFDGDRALPRCRGNGRGAAHRMRHGRLRALLVGDAQDPTQRRRRPGACATKRQPPGSEPAPPPCAHLTDQLSPLFWRRDRGRWTLILRIASAARRSG